VAPEKNLGGTGEINKIRCGLKNILENRGEEKLKKRQTYGRRENSEGKNDEKTQDKKRGYLGDE